MRYTRVVVSLSIRRVAFDPATDLWLRSMKKTSSSSFGNTLNRVCRSNENLFFVLGIKKKVQKRVSRTLCIQTKSLPERNSYPMWTVFHGVRSLLFILFAPCGRGGGKRNPVVQYKKKKRIVRIRHGLIIQAARVTH